MYLVHCVNVKLPSFVHDLFYDCRLQWMFYYLILKRLFKVDQFWCI